MSIRFEDIAYALPAQIISNADLVAENSSWDITRIEGRSGVLERHIAGADETALDLAVEACRQLFQRHPDLPARVDALIVCTQSPDYIMPPNSCLLHKSLELAEEVLAFDFNLACSGFVYGLAIIKGLVAAGMARNVLFVTGDTYSRYIHANDRSARVLFGDGVAATWITSSAGQGAGVVDILCGTMGALYDRFIIPAGGLRMPKSQQTAQPQVDESGNIRTAENIYMDGMGIMEFVLAKVPAQVRTLLTRNQMTVADIDLFVFHQASKLVLDSLARVLRIPPEKMFQNIAHLGNTVSATIPIALKEAMDAGMLQRGQKVLMSGFGVGLSWASAIAEV